MDDEEEQAVLPIVMMFFNIFLDHKVLGYGLSFAVFMAVFAYMGGGGFFDYLYVKGGHLPNLLDWLAYLPGSLH